MSLKRCSGFTSMFLTKQCEFIAPILPTRWKLQMAQHTDKWMWQPFTFSSQRPTLVEALLLWPIMIHPTYPYKKTFSTTHMSLDEQHTKSPVLDKHMLICVYFVINCFPLLKALSGNVGIWLKLLTSNCSLLMTEDGLVGFFVTESSLCKHIEMLS